MVFVKSSANFCVCPHTMSVDLACASQNLKVRSLHCAVVDWSIVTTAQYESRTQVYILQWESCSVFKGALQFDT